MALQYNLNKKRILIGRLVLLFAFILNLLTNNHLPQHKGLHHFFDSFGLILLDVCMLGRIYCTLQIGGHKNTDLVTTGIYSTVRNPLYFFTFIGVIGMGLISAEITVFILLTAGFFLVYIPLIGREENFLQDKFGTAFSDYVSQVPRLVPNFSQYKPAGTVTINMETLHSALRDALWWLLPFIVFETIEWVQHTWPVVILAKIW